eukprot:3510073-Pleurochrysis_carterae.AAC.1
MLGGGYVGKLLTSVASCVHTRAREGGASAGSPKRSVCVHSFRCWRSTCRRCRGLSGWPTALIRGEQMTDSGRADD